MKEIIFNWASGVMIQIGFPILIGIFSILILKGLNKLNQIFKLSIDEATLKGWSDTIARHVFAVEEMNAKYIKDDPQKTKQLIMSSEEKMDYVVNETLRTIGDVMSRHQITQMANSIIAKTQGIGATK
jgi:hypothetical protein